MSDPISRREALKRSLSLAVIAVGVPLVGACSKKPTEIHCDDTAGLKPDEIEARKTLAYVDRSPDPNKQCQNCQQLVAPPNDTSCGTCKVLKGSVHPNGYCKSWAAKGAPAASSG